MEKKNYKCLNVRVQEFSTLLRFVRNTTIKDTVPRKIDVFTITRRKVRKELKKKTISWEN